MLASTLWFSPTASTILQLKNYSLSQLFACSQNEDSPTCICSPPSLPPSSLPATSSHHPPSPQSSMGLACVLPNLSRLWTRLSSTGPWPELAPWPCRKVWRRWRWVRQSRWGVNNVVMDGPGFGRVVVVGAMHDVHVIWINQTLKFSFQRIIDEKCHPI